MINILTDSMPKTVEICGQKYPINSDFRAAVIVGVKECEKRLSRESRETVREILKEFGYDINDVMA